VCRCSSETRSLDSRFTDATDVVGSLQT
jgi:hypothetical protein